MRLFWDERQRAHRPALEFFNGALHPAADRPERVDSILGALGATEAPPEQSDEELIAALRSVHDAAVRTSKSARTCSLRGVATDVVRLHACVPNGAGWFAVIGSRHGLG